MTITFASPVVLTGLTGVWVVGGETPFLSPRVSSGGQPVDPTASCQDPSGVFLLSFSATVSEIDILVSSWPLYLMSLTWKTPDIDMPVLPQAPGLYALKVVTQIQAGQPDSNGHVSYQPVADGDPVIEFAYLQTASGPGTATVEPATVGSDGFTTPDPDRTPPTPTLAEAAATPATAFPNGGRLNNLSTYTQWSWPRDGDAAAYYGYDLNVEFTETYVNALYATFLTSGAPYQYTGDPLIPALHLRCVDRNQRHTLLMPSDIHVPSAPPQSANVSRVLAPPPPDTISSGGAALPGSRPISGLVSATAVAAAQQQLERRAAITPDQIAKPAFDAAIRAAGLTIAPDALGPVLSVSPGTVANIRHELAELAAAAQARNLWFAPLAPQTRYTVDVVAGPLPTGRGEERIAVTSGGLSAIYDATDAIGALAALQAFLAREDALTSLQRVQFTTSRYATFSDQVANIVAQSAGTAATPIRRYAVPPGADAQALAGRRRRRGGPGDGAGRATSTPARRWPWSWGGSTRCTTCTRRRRRPIPPPVTASTRSQRSVR